MKKSINYYVVGGQYNAYCYGGAETLRGAKLIAARHDEYHDNWKGWHRPSIYAASDCKTVTGFYGETVAPIPGSRPVAVYDYDAQKWVADPV